MFVSVREVRGRSIIGQYSDLSNALTISQEKVAKRCGSVSDLSNAVTISQEKVTKRCGSVSDLSNAVTILTEKVEKSSKALTILQEKVSCRCGSEVRFVKRFDDFARKSRKIVKGFDDFARKSHKSIRRSAMLLGKSPVPSGIFVKLDRVGTPSGQNSHVLDKCSGKEGRERGIGTIGSLGRSRSFFSTFFST